jgi:hypothetical protein
VAGSLLVFNVIGIGQAREFHCTAAEMTCLFDSLTEAKFNGESNTIFLENGTYTGMQLPSISSAFPLTITGQDPAQTIVSGAGQALSNVFFIANGANLTLERVTVSGATAGGIQNAGTLTLINAIVRSNTNFVEGAGISNSGAAEIFNSTISKNASIDSFGGGIYNLGTMSISDSTVANNTAGGAITSGNGIQNSGTLNIINTTIAQNSRPAEVRGGGIDNTGTLTIINGTISENRGTSGGGIANVGAATTQLRNTIVAGNIGGTSQVFDPGGPDCAGVVLSLGSNLIGEPRDCEIGLQLSDITGAARLGKYTEDVSIPGSGHYPVLADSRAVDAADPSVCPETDQLDNARVGNCDVGAIEFAGGTAEPLVQINITPRSDARNINPLSKDTLEVAVLSGPDTDLDTISKDSLRFGPTGAESEPKKITSKHKNRDRKRDLLLRFVIRDLGIQCGNTTLVLTGQFSDGTSFNSGTPITTKCKAHAR